eukprot:GFUD01032916.1.p1 GENE.GFUD01032916.1~~GFUD01032916.1.p1  ORF type:complete len:268 (+),score=59.70 GFUD01032916.1:22-804(+)
MLQDLPPELLLKIISLLSLKDALILSTTCRTVCSTVLGVSNTFHRHWVLQYLKLIPENVKIGRINQEACNDWKLTKKEAQSLFRRLANCPPPGCEGQKYLRWLQGRPADCDIVRRVLVGVSMLPASFSEMTESVDEKDESKIIRFTKRSKIILNWLFPEEKDRIKDRTKVERLLETDKPVGPFFNFDKFQVLMEYVMESNERLRLVMAEYHQISCRGLFEHVGFSSWTRPHAFMTNCRQMGALLDLIKLNNQSPGIRFWA